jgi:cytochrome P450
MHVLMDPLQEVSPELLADPYPIYHEMRREAPVLFWEKSGNWLITGYPEVLAALRDPRLRVARVAPFMDLLPESCQQQTTFLREVLSRWLFVVDPPQHTRLRALLQGAFVPGATEALRERITSLAHTLLDSALDESARGTVDLVKTLADPLPAMVAADLLGFPRADWAQLKRWTDTIAHFIGEQLAAAERALEAQRSMEA